VVPKACTVLWDIQSQKFVQSMFLPSNMAKTRNHICVLIKRQKKAHEGKVQVSRVKV